MNIHTHHSSFLWSFTHKDLPYHQIPTNTNKQNHNITKRLIAGTIFFLSLLLAASVTITKADNLNSNSFGIKMGTINMTGGEKTSSSYTLSDTVGQTFQGAFDSTGVKVRAGFQYVRPNIPFRFTISNLDINFGSLVAGVGGTASNTLTISNGSSGYTVKALEDHPLRLIGLSNTIPDTACDATTICTTTDANIWIQSTRFGFGYSMSGQDVDTTDFVNSTYYRPFPADSASAPPATIMSRTSSTTGSVATVTYKINYSGSQAAGKYQNSIQYIATPTY